MAKKIIIAIITGAGIVLAAMFATKKLMIPVDTSDEAVEVE